MRARAGLLKFIATGMVAALATVLLVAPAASATDSASQEAGRAVEAPSDGRLCLCAVIKTSKAGEQALQAVWRAFIQGDGNYCGARSDDNPSAPGCVLHVFTMPSTSNVCAEHKLLNRGAGIFYEEDRDRASFVATKCDTLIPKALNPLSPQWVK